MSPDLGIMGGSGDTYTLAIALLTISFAFAGLCIGIGMALRLRRLETFGKEELMQASIGVVMVGALAALIGSMTASFELAPASDANGIKLNSSQANMANPCRAMTAAMTQAARQGGMAGAGAGGAFGIAGLTLSYSLTPTVPDAPAGNFSANNRLIGTLVDSQRCYSNILHKEADKKRTVAMIVTSLSSLKIHTGGEEEKPKAGTGTSEPDAKAPESEKGKGVSFNVINNAKSYIMDNLDDDFRKMKIIADLADEESWIMTFVDSTAFALFLPIGLLFRLFFPTRRLGGWIMAMAVAAYVIYPLLMVTSGTAFMQSLLDSGKMTIPAPSSACEELQQYESAGKNDKGLAYQLDVTLRCQQDSRAASSQIDQAIVKSAGFMLSTLPSICILFALLAVWPLAEVFGGEYHFAFGEMI